MPCHSSAADSPKSLLSRRRWLQRAGGGFGLIGLAGLLQQEGLLDHESRAAEASLNPMAARPGHFAARAKRVIWIFTNGGPSQVDTWDYKPALERWHGRSMRDFDPSFKNTTGFFKDQVGALMKSPFRFTPRGQCGKMVSEIFPHLGRHVDKMAFLHSVFTESNNHSPALFMMNTGLRAHGVPLRRFVGDVRPGERGRQPAGIRRDERSEGPWPAQGARGELGRGIPAGRLSGDAPPPQGPADR